MFPPERGLEHRVWHILHDIHDNWISQWTNTGPPTLTPELLVPCFCILWETITLYTWNREGWKCRCVSCNMSSCIKVFYLGERVPLYLTITHLHLCIIIYHHHLSSTYCLTIIYLSLSITNIYHLYVFTNHVSIICLPIIYLASVCPLSIHLSHQYIMYIYIYLAIYHVSI